MLAVLAVDDGIVVVCPAAVDFDEGTGQSSWQKCGRGDLVTIGLLPILPICYDAGTFEDGFPYLLADSGREVGIRWVSVDR